MKRYFLFFFLFLFCIPLALGSFTDEWGEYQDDESSSGYVNDVASNFLAFGDTLSVNDGMNYQPMVVNMTGDGDLEIVIYSGNYLQIYDDTLSLIDENNIGSPNEAQLVIYDDGTDNIIVTIVDDVVEAYSYNSTAFIDEFVNDSEINASFSCSAWLGLRCEGDMCYTLCDNTTHTFIIELDMDNNNFTESAGLSPNIANGTPALGDIDRDGNTEIAWLCDADGNGNYGVCVADLSTLALDTGFSADGIIDDIALVNRMGNPVIWNIDEGGDMEVILSYQEPTPSGLTIASYNSDGTLSWETVHGLGVTTAAIFIGNPMIMEFPSTRPDVCAFGKDNSASDVITYLCTDYEGTLLVNDSFVYGGVNAIEQGWNTIAAPVIDGTICTDATCDLDIITTRFIMDRSDWSVYLNITDLDNDYFIAYADVNDDGEAEIIGTRAGTTQIIFSNFSNQPPDLYSNLTYSGYGSSPYGFGDILCVNTTITYSAQETVNYNNDGGSDTERIQSDCFGNTTWANGTYSASTPSITCVYDTAGTYQTVLYLQDEFNDDDLTEYNSPAIPVTVINGIDGVSCNVGTADAIGEYSLPSTTTQATDNAFAQIFDPILGRSDEVVKIKMFIGFMLLATIIIGAFQKGVRESFPLAMITVAGIIVLTIMTLFPVYLMLLMIFSMVLILLLGRFIIGGRAGEGV